MPMKRRDFITTAGLASAALIAGCDGRKGTDLERVRKTDPWSKNRVLKADFIPAEDPKSKALLIVLHGLGDSSRGWEWLPDELRLPWMEYAILNAPDPYYGGFSWYELHGDAGPGVRRSREALFQFIQARIAEGRAAERISLLGFSQGCLMTFDVGWRFPSRLGALVGISGYIHEPETLLNELAPEARKVPALFTHGTRDPIVPIAPVREQAKRLKEAGLDLEWREFDKPHTVAGEPEVRLIREFLTRHLGPA
jgi:phospholipase/carboxylesterase